MKFINGTNRNQLPFLPHRLMMPLRKTTKSDLLTFLDSLKLADFGFIFDFVENGRPAYHPSVTQTLYLRLSQSHAFLQNFGERITATNLCGF
jgi:hypothetical protein